MVDNIYEESLSVEELDKKIEASGDAIRRQLNPFAGDYSVKFIRDRMEVQIDWWNELNKKLVRYAKDPTKRMMVKQINVLLMSLVECSKDIIGLYTELTDIYLRKINEDKKRYSRKMQKYQEKISKATMGKSMREAKKMGGGVGEYTPSEVSADWKKRVEEDVKRGYHANFMSFRDFCDKAYLKYRIRLKYNTWVKYLTTRGISTATDVVPKVPKSSHLDEGIEI